MVHDVNRPTGLDIFRNEGKAPVVVDLFDKEFQLSDLAKGIKSY